MSHHELKTHPQPSPADRAEGNCSKWKEDTKILKEECGHSGKLTGKSSYLAELSLVESLSPFSPPWGPLRALLQGPGSGV